jgi:hypothetical protein
MKTLFFILVTMFSAQIFAACITAKDKSKTKEVSNVVQRATGGQTSWTEVKAGTNIKETSNTIVVSLNFSNLLASKVSVGIFSGRASEMCVVGSALTIKASGKVITIRRNGDRLLVNVPDKPQYQLLPSEKIRQKKSEGVPIPKFYQEPQLPATVSA